MSKGEWAILLIGVLLILVDPLIAWALLWVCGQQLSLLACYALWGEALLVLSNVWISWRVIFKQDTPVNGKGRHV